MSSFRPLFARQGSDPAFDEPQEGVPSWMRESVFAWVAPFVNRYVVNRWVASEKALRELENRLRLGRRLEWDDGAEGAQRDLFVRMRSDGDFALTVIDYHLWYMRSFTSAPARDVDELAEILRDGGSAWEPTKTEDNQHWALTRRALGPAREAIAEIATTSDRVGKHLNDAWVRLAGRNPDPSAAYREAVRAVEAAAKPIVLPNDSLATLGKIIGTIRDKPEKWTFELGPPLLVVDMAASIHRSQLDRHGTDDESVPLSVSPEQADAAVYLAITLSRYFVHGAFKKA